MPQSQYATEAELQALSITPAAFNRFGSTACTAALQAASSIADSYLVSQFVLPLQVSPQGWDMSLTLQVSNIAAWLLYNQFGFSPMAPGDELVTKRYESALEWLAQIRDKKIFPLFVDSGTVPVGSDEAGDFFISDPPVGFTDRGLANSINDVCWWGWDW